MTNAENINQDRFQKLEKNRHGIISMLLLVVGCSAGIAVGLGALTQVFSLIILAFTTMAALSMILALAPMKYIVYTSVVAVVADVLIITVNLLS
jgi:hypothetical protein